MKHLYSFCLVNCTLCLVLLSGCGRDSRPADLPKLYPCTVVISQEGKTLEGAMVEFIAEDAKYKPVALTNSNGKAVISTYGFPGVPAGKYKVIVSKLEDGDFTYGTNSAGEQEIATYKTYRVIDEVFSNAATTPLETEITGKDRKLVVPFDVGKTVKVRL